ncbi:MAG: amidohydrolase family protein, partial [Pirellulaceae bacterium]
MLSTRSRAMLLGLTLPLFFLHPTGHQQAFAEQPGATQIYFGGDILTMQGPTAQYAESLVVRDGKILFAGDLATAQKQAGNGAQRIDLGGKTLLPGFIDTHGHFVYFGKNLVDANLFNCADISDLIARMKKQAEQTPEGAWIVGFGYQARSMTEKRPPTSEELDQISADRPVLVVDSSGHLGAANSAAFRAAGISADTPDPTGGAFTRGKDGKSLLGPMEETALNAVRGMRPPFSDELAKRAMLGASEVWASYG